MADDNKIDPELQKLAQQHLNDLKLSKISPDSLPNSPTPYSDTGRIAQSPREKVESYLGAPIRAALSAASKKQLEPDQGFFSTAPTVEGLKAGWNQMGKDPRTAPTAKDTMAAAGMSTIPFSQTPGLSQFYRKTDDGNWHISPKAGGMFDPSPAGIAGEGLNMETDPLMHSGINKPLATGLTQGTGVRALQEATPIFNTTSDQMAYLKSKGMTPPPEFPPHYEAESTPSWDLGNANPAEADNSLNIANAKNLDEPTHQIQTNMPKLNAMLKNKSAALKTPITEEPDVYDLSDYDTEEK